MLKSFTFYFIVLSVFIILGHYVGGDSKNIALIHFNPILSKLQYTSFGKHYLNSGPIVYCNTISGKISVYWYVAQFITSVFYGAVLDFIKLMVKKYRTNLSHSYKSVYLKKFVLSKGNVCF